MVVPEIPVGSENSVYLILTVLTMYIDYERLVMEDYQRKKKNNVLSSQLIHPTPARIKKECLRLCAGKLQSKDEKVIRDFCEEWDNAKTCLQNIDKCEVDKFRPLVNFLKGETETTDPKNVHLLAWLIDFPDRPFQLGKVYIQSIEAQVGDEVQESLANATVDALPFHEESQGAVIEKTNIVAVSNREARIEPVKQKWKFRKVAVIGVWLTVIGTGGYWGWNTMQQENGGCMYWANDHYEPIPCNQKPPNTLVVALDTTKVRNFKKIMREDTITHQAIGHVWYSKINNIVEFFTADGNHPVFIDRHLKPLTDHIINAHIHQGMTTSSR